MEFSLLRWTVQGEQIIKIFLWAVDSAISTRYFDWKQVSHIFCDISVVNKLESDSVGIRSAFNSHQMTSLFDFIFYWLVALAEY